LLGVPMVGVDVDIMGWAKRAHKMKFKNIWTALVDSITFLWLFLFIFSQISAGVFWISFSLKVLLGIFILDLVFLYWWPNHPPLKFLQEMWFNVLMVVPFFRPLRLLRINRFAKTIRILKKGKSYYKFFSKLKGSIKSLSEKLRGDLEKTRESDD